MTWPPAAYPLATDKTAGVQYPLADHPDHHNDLAQAINDTINALGVFSTFNVETYGAVGDGTTDDTAAIQAAINACNTAGGGTVLFPPGASYSATNITPKSNVRVVAYGATLINRAPGATALFRHMDDVGGLTNFTLEGATCTDGNYWYSRGNVTYSRFEHNRFYGDAAVNTFLLFLDAFAANPHNIITHNLFSGVTGGWDMLGSGALDFSEISFNRFEDGDGQGWGITSCNYARCIGNVFSEVGNAIGFEGDTVGCVVQGNLVYRSGNIKLAQVGGVDTSTNNIVQGNLLAYSGGIEDGEGRQDQIIGNTILKSESKGIFGCFHHCRIADNLLFDTNWNNTAVTVAGGSHTDGGIVLLDNAAIATPTRNHVQNNKLYGTNANWTHPDSSTRQGYMGGIAVDASYDKTLITGNTFDGTYETVINGGTATIIRGNPGYNPVGHAVTQPAVAATTVAVTNTTGVDCTVFVNGGTVTVVAIGGTATGQIAGAFRVPAGSTIAITYSVAPTWQWFGD